MIGGPLSPGIHGHRKKPKICAGHGTCDSTSPQLGPQAFRVAVEEQEVLLVKESRDAKCVPSAVRARVVHDTRPAQRTPANDNRLCADVIVHDLVPVQNSHGICLGDSGEVYAKDHVVRFETAVSLRRGNEGGMVQRRNSILWRSTGLNLVQRNDVPGRVKGLLARASWDVGDLPLDSELLLALCRKRGASQEEQNTARHEGG